MAKKQAATATPPEDDCIERLYKQIESDFGSSILVSGDEAIDEKPQIISISPSLDIATSGGIIGGSFVGITGHEKTTKTSTALVIAANAQKPQNGSRRVFYGKVEGRLSLHHLQGIRGLDTRKGPFNIIQSTSEKILTTQDYLAIFLTILKTVPNAVLIIDSISALCDEKEQTDGVGTETRGGGAKLFSQFCRLANQVVPVQKSIVIGISHLISNTSGMGAKYTERAARAWGYQCDYQLRTITKEPWKVGEQTIGLKVRWVCKTSPLGPPEIGVDSYFRFGIGLDILYELISFGTAANLISKSGSWYALDFIEGKPKAQGLEAIYQMLLGKPEWAETLRQRVLAVTVGTSSDE